MADAHPDLRYRAPPCAAVVHSAASEREANDRGPSMRRRASKASGHSRSRVWCVWRKPCRRPAQKRGGRCRSELGVIRRCWGDARCPPPPAATGRQRTKTLARVCTARCTCGRTGCGASWTMPMQRGAGDRRVEHLGGPWKLERLHKHAGAAQLQSGAHRASCCAGRVRVLLPQRGTVR